MVDLSIVIVNYNTQEMLLACIASIYRGSRTLSVEIIVVDNNSTDKSKEAVRNEFPKAILIQNVHNMGFGSAANRGAAEARGKYIAILNPDTLISANTLRTMIDFLNLHPKIGALGCRLVGSDLRPQSSCARFPTPFRVLSLFTRLDKILPMPFVQTYYNRFDWKSFAMIPWIHSESRVVDTILGAFFITPLDIFKKVNGFDERYFMYYEEVDLFRKIWQKGFYVFFLSSVDVVHFGGEATKQDYARMRFEQQRSLLLYLKKWHGAYAAELIRCFLILLAFLRLVGALVIQKKLSYKRKINLDHRRTAITMLRGLLKIDIRRCSTLGDNLKS